MLTYDGWMLAKERIVNLIESTNIWAFTHIYEKNFNYGDLKPFSVGTIYQSEFEHIVHHNNTRMTYDYTVVEMDRTREYKFYEQCNGALFIVEERHVDSVRKEVTSTFRDAFIVFSDNRILDLDTTLSYTEMAEYLEAI